MKTFFSRKKLSLLSSEPLILVADQPVEGSCKKVEKNLKSNWSIHARDSPIKLKPDDQINVTEVAVKSTLGYYRWNRTTSAPKSVPRG